MNVQKFHCVDELNVSPQKPLIVQDSNQQFKEIYFLKKIAFTPIGNGASLSSNEVLGLDPEVIFEIFLVAQLLRRGCNRIRGCIFPGAVYGREAV